MKKILLLGALVGILLAIGLPAIATKYRFDLSKGPVSFSYTTIGAYNPIEITIVGKNGVAQTWLASDYYQSQTLLEAMNELLMKQHGAVPWLDLKVESLNGKLSFKASTHEGVQVRLEMEGSPGNITARLETSGVDEDTSEKEVHATVQVNAEIGQLTVKDSSPSPEGNTVLGQKYGVPPRQLSQLLDQFGRSRVMNALETAGNRNGVSLAQNGAVAGGGASIAEGSVSLSNLAPEEVFRISLWGLKYQGYLRDSTLYMRLLHPANGVSIRDMRVILTVVDLEPPESLHGAHIVLWDVFPYDYQAGCYLYHLNSTSWRPGAYEVYIDVGQILNFKLPITVTNWHQVVARRG